MAYKGRRGSVEPATVVKVEVSGCFWLRASSHEIVAGPQAELKPPVGLVKKDFNKVVRPTRV